MHPPPGEQVDHGKYDETAIRAIKDRRQLPEIDFSIHRMEDGNEVSTLERVCKGMSMLQGGQFLSVCSYIELLA